MLEDSARDIHDQPAIKLVLRYLGPGHRQRQLHLPPIAGPGEPLCGPRHALGVRKGDRVALMRKDLRRWSSPSTALKLGAIVVNTNPTYTSREIEQQFADAGAETVVLLSSLYGKLQAVQARTAIKRVIIADVPDYVPMPWKALVKSSVRKQGQMVDVAEGEGIYSFRKLLDAHPEAPPQVDIASDEVALFQYTGGTTGVPKAAMLTHYNAVANTIQIRQWLHVVEDGKDRVLGAIPFFHVYGMTVAMSLAVYAGAQLLIVPNPRHIDSVIEVIDRERASIFPGVPTMYIGVIHHPKVKDYDLKSVKACISGAAPLPMDVQLQFGEITGGRLVEGYGLTEAAPVTHCNPITGERRAGSIGLPPPDVEAKIVDYGIAGDARGPGSARRSGARPASDEGYWQRDDETAKTVTADGWLRTGDIARMDADGYFYIVDRLKDIIIASGFNIVPREVEEVLFEHPKVQEAVVAGVPDARRGETVKAYIVLKPGETATVDEIVAFCKERLAPYKVPRQVEFRSELPKTMVGKFLRRVLVEEEQNKLSG